MATTTAKLILLTRFPYCLWLQLLQASIRVHLGGSMRECNEQNVILFRMLRRNGTTLRCTSA